MAVQNVNVSWQLAQGTVTLTDFAAATRTIDNTLKETPILDDGADEHLLGFDTIKSGAQALSWWLSLSVRRAIVFLQNLDWVEYEEDLTTGTILKVNYGTFAIA